MDAVFSFNPSTAAGNLLTDRLSPAFIYARGLSDEPRGVTMFVVKSYKSGPLRGTRGEPTRAQP
ncbi:hypothetical protein NQZ68_041664 [Dissostichus eleginoides]|nr:hypothetical protein NQZ68_007750 [Dissostichus eleginoides]KAI9535717.1 hypothetical protein NQZ68_041664 [Dissostichus eleginoides]